MTTRSDVELQFIAWNFAGKGGDRLTGGNWRFRKHVMYYQDAPFKRVVKGKAMPIMLVKHSTRSENVFTQPSETNPKSGIVYKSWTMPEIGVWSRYEGDELSEQDLHERQHFLMIAEMAAVMEDYVALSSGADLAGPIGRTILARVDRMTARYFNYGLIFGQNWGEMPRLYREQIVDAIKAKVARYHDPKAVAQRERTHARKIAKQAFGIS